MIENNLQEILSYDPERGEIRWKVARNRKILVGSLAGTLKKNGRVQIKADGKLYLAHRLAWLLHYGSWPSGEIDHLDGNPRNNCIANLRDVDRLTNAQNRRTPNKGNSSGYLGARRVLGSVRRARWDAVIHSAGKTIFLGRFDSPLEAHERYVTAKRDLHVGCTL